MTVQSVLEQTFEDFELLLMDDGSTDNTGEMVSSFSDSRIHYDCAPNSGGPATPRNRGINLASAPWICFLDSDDIWYPTRLSDVAHAISQKPESDVFCHNEMLHTEGTNKKSLLKHGPYERDFYRILLTQGNRLSTSAVTVRADFLLKHKLRFNQASDYTIVEDYDLWLRLAKHEAGFLFISKPLGEYIIGNDNITLATARARHNQLVVLKDHVYNIQQFEPDKDKLWCQIHLRLDLEEARELIQQGKIANGLRLLASKAASQPVQLLKTLATKLRNKFTRVCQR